MGSEQVTCLAMGSPSLRFAGAEAEERRARERQRAVRTVVSGGAVSPRQPQYMNIMIIFSGGVDENARTQVEQNLPRAPPSDVRLLDALYLHAHADVQADARAHAPVNL